MFYRRKVILALLQQFDNLGKTQVQKLLLLFCQEQQKPEYSFVPYKYGAYSFSLAADLFAMEKQNQISVINQRINKIGGIDYISQLKEKDQKILTKINILHKKKSYTDLIKYTYTKFPYYAINSTIADRYLSAEQLNNVNSYKPAPTRTVLFTIGYEGVSLEEYLNKLIQNGVKVLVDVRNNPISMKYGFSKSQLVTSCNSVSIEYVHFPEVGILSEQRQQLNNQADYDSLFEIYKSKNLKNTVETQHKILILLQKYKRIALTCFEANICQCHRKHLAEAISILPEFFYELKHL